MSEPAEPAERRLYHGVTREARALLAAAWARDSPGGVTLVVSAQAARARELAAGAATCAEWMKHGVETAHFPEPPAEEVEGMRRDDQLADRLAVLGGLLGAGRTHLLVTTTPEALLAACPGPGFLRDTRLELRAGENRSFERLVEALARELDYDAEALCEHPGQFAVRGGLVDVYPFDAVEPVRIDFFGDEIESIRTFDPASQRTLRMIERVVLPPAPTRGERGAAEGAFLDYLPERGVVWIFEDPELLVREHPVRFDPAPGPAGGHCRTIPAALARRAGRGDRLAGLCEIDTAPELFEGAPRTVLATEAVAGYRLHPAAAHGEGRLESETGARARFEQQLADWVKKDGLGLHIAVSGETERDRIAALLAANPLTAALVPAYHEGAVEGGFIFRFGSEDRSLALPGAGGANGFVLVTADDYFGRRRQQPGRGRERARPVFSQVDALLDFSDLADGDPLVHLQHGVCFYRGLSRLEIEGAETEVISIEFADAITLHVPLHESHLLTRYVGLGKARPKPAKVGGAGWQKARRAAERAALDYAAELLNLEARRSASEGHAFAGGHGWLRRFEEACPFRETPDQMRAILETRADMESPRPMDRLVCGDVGFGKTEVALRAVFAAVLDGKQAAVLVPTTVLCQQHLNTFRERLADYPVRIEMVSRFHTAAQNRTVLADLAAGRVEIVIGTHRLLSRDVHFRDLGLLVCDEEQRFGVRQKERIKKLRASIDVLTLSATPIPRTLYLAMAGARAMSVIETPPADRRPIETIVRRYDPDLVRAAVQAEVDRGGQVFYLHNRVATIERTAAELRALLPRLRIAVGHGQMGEHVLEKVMTRFVAGEFDVLVCTTIIESGLDLPNCNTLIIEGADRFGLSQLYQIRGRVGRFNRQAYAYLLLHRHGHVVEQAHKRLNALKQHNQLGAGYRIAMRDLELRGAGNLLGPQQSGHIAGVGFELYCQLLRESVSRLKGEPGADHIRAEVKLDFIASGEGGAPVRKASGSEGFAALKEAEYAGRRGDAIEAVLPEAYVAEPRLRIDLYRRLAQARTSAGIDELAAELEDRFGPPPPPARALLAVSRIRTEAEAAGVRRVETEGNRLICRLTRPRDDGEYLKAGPRFPRLTARNALLRLEEISAFLRRHARS